MGPRARQLRARLNASRDRLAKRTGRTVADVRIDDRLRRYTVEDDPEMKKWIAQVVKGAIVKSLNSGLQYKVDDAIMP